MVPLLMLIQLLGSLHCAHAVSVADVSGVRVVPIFRTENEVVTSHRTALFEVRTDTVLSSKMNVLCLVDTECCCGLAAYLF